MEEDVKERCPAWIALGVWRSRTVSPRVQAPDVEGSPNVLVLALLLCDNDGHSRASQRILNKSTYSCHREETVSLLDVRPGILLSPDRSVAASTMTIPSQRIHREADAQVLYCNMYRIDKFRAWKGQFFATQSCRPLRKPTFDPGSNQGHFRCFICFCMFSISVYGAYECQNNLLRLFS